MTGTAFETGATLVLRDDFSRTLDKLFLGIDKAQRGLTEFQEKLDKVGMSASVRRISGQLEEINGLSKGAADKIALNFAGLEDKVSDGFAAMAKAAGTEMENITKASRFEAGEIEGNFAEMWEKSDTGFAAMSKSAGEEFQAMTGASLLETGNILGNFTALSSGVDEAFAGMVESSRVTAEAIARNFNGAAAAASAGTARAGSVARPSLQRQVARA